MSGAMSLALMLKPELALGEQVEYMEKRRLFLQSYHFSRKQSGGEKARRSLVRVRRLIWVRLRAARRLRRSLWQRLRSAWTARTKRFDRLAVQPRQFCFSSREASW